MSAGAIDAALGDLVREIVRYEVRAALAEDGASARGALRNGDAYLSIAKASRFADVAPGTLRRWIRSGRLPVRRAGRVYRVARAELEDFLARQGRGTGVVERARAMVSRSA